MRRLGSHVVGVLLYSVCVRENGYGRTEDEKAGANLGSQNPRGLYRARPQILSELAWVGSPRGPSQASTALQVCTLRWQSCVSVTWALVTKAGAPESGSPSFHQPSGDVGTAESETLAPGVTESMAICGGPATLGVITDHSIRMAAWAPCLMETQNPRSSRTY